MSSNYLFRWNSSVTKCLVPCRYSQNNFHCLVLGCPSSVQNTLVFYAFACKPASRSETTIVKHITPVPPFLLPSLATVVYVFHLSLSISKPAQASHASPSRPHGCQESWQKWICFLAQLVLILHDNLIAQRSSASSPVLRTADCGGGGVNWDRQRVKANGGTEITMFRCGEVKWTRESGNRAQDSTLHWHKAPQTGNPPA